MEIIDVFFLYTAGGAVIGFIVRGWAERGERRLAYGQGFNDGVNRWWPVYWRALLVGILDADRAPAGDAPRDRGASG